MTDELKHDTAWTYDAFGRVLTQTLPDRTTVTRTYAPHLTGNQVATLSVTTWPDSQGKVQTWQPGTQEFDGLGRLTKRVSGGRTSMYADMTFRVKPEPLVLTIFFSGLIP